MSKEKDIEEELSIETLNKINKITHKEEKEEDSILNGIELKIYDSDFKRRLIDSIENDLLTKISLKKIICKIVKEEIKEYDHLNNDKCLEDSFKNRFSDLEKEFEKLQKRLIEKEKEKSTIIYTIILTSIFITFIIGFIKLI